MSTTPHTFILAAGEARRWDGPGLKQWLLVEDYPVLLRTLSRFKDFDPVVATHLPEILDNLLVDCVRPGKRSCTAETLHSVLRFCGTDNLILFSDVYYTDAAVGIIKNSGELQFFTDGQDIFALRITAAWLPGIKTLLEKVIERAHTPEGNEGRLWELYRALVGDEFKFPLIPDDKPRDVTFIGDQTQDFDTLEDYENFKNGKSKNILWARKSS